MKNLSHYPMNKLHIFSVVYPLGGRSTNPLLSFVLALFFSVYHRPSLPLRNHGGPRPGRENPPGGFGIDCGLIRA